MFRNALIASLVLFGTAGAALAQDNGPRLVGGGGDGGPRVEYAEPSQNVVGGGYARITGEAGNRTIAYSGAAQRQAPTGLIAEITGEAGNRHVTYHAPGAAAGQLAGNPARIGG